MKFKFNIAGLISKLSAKNIDAEDVALFEVEKEQVFQKDGYDVRITPHCNDPDLSEFCFMEEWTKDGVLDRQGAPSIFYVNKFNGETYRREFYKDGKLHNDDGPAVMQGDLRVLLLEWYKAGEIHRENGPARLEAIPELNRTMNEEWWVNNKCHRIGAPAILRYNACVNPPILEHEIWSVDGKHHREDGPAETYNCHRTGKKHYEKWSINGQLHRKDGPADIRWDRNTGQISRADKYHFGERTGSALSPHQAPIP